MLKTILTRGLVVPRLGCTAAGAQSTTIQLTKTNLHTTPAALMLRDQDKYGSVNKLLSKVDDGSKGERSVDLDVTGFEKVVEFPKVDLPTRVFEGIQYSDIPIVVVRATKNNTHYQLTTPDGLKTLAIRSCGFDGFKNCRKRTNVAAQVTGTQFARRIMKMGYKTVRVCVSGLGAGRLASFKGMTLQGLSIVSITDITPIFDYLKERPPAARSV